jgi:hypothetical protein
MSPLNGAVRFRLPDRRALLCRHPHQLHHGVSATLGPRLLPLVRHTRWPDAGYRYAKEEHPWQKKSIPGRYAFEPGSKKWYPLTGYYENANLLQTSLEAIARRYLRSWFVFDLVSAIPQQVLPVRGPVSYLRLVKILRFFRYAAYIEAKVRVSPTAREARGRGSNTVTGALMGRLIFCPEQCIFISSSVPPNLHA